MMLPMVSNVQCFFYLPKHDGGHVGIRWRFLLSERPISEVKAKDQHNKAIFLAFELHKACEII